MSAADADTPLTAGTELEQYFATVDGPPEAVFSDGPPAATVRTPSVDRNRIFALRLHTATAEAEIEELLAPFRKAAIPVSWYADEQATPCTLPELLARHGVTFQYVWRTMERSLEIVPVPLQYIPDFTIVPAVSEQERNLWGQVILDGFGLSHFEDLHTYLASTGLVSGRWHRLTAVMRGTPVGGALLFTGNGKAGLHWLAVLPEKRRHGVGTNLIRAACAEAVQMEYRSLALQCNPDLVPLYDRMGFRETGAISVFEWRPGIVNTTSSAE